MIRYRTFTGKVLLFGEYTVIGGSRALVIPLKNFSGKLEFIQPVGQYYKESAITSSRSLGRYLAYIRDTSGLYGSDHEGLKQLEQDIAKGLFFHSDIPVEYGVGSSAALVAAVYDAYLKDEQEPDPDLPILKSLFSTLESYFHGSSSGIDPLCSYMGRSLDFKSDTIRIAEIPPLENGHAFFLLDTGISGETAPLVSRYRERISSEKDFREKVSEHLTPMVEEAVRLLKQGDGAAVLENVRRISALQLVLFHEMIPESIVPVWKRALEGRDCALKLCGSGGGGFVLGFTRDIANSINELSSEGYEIIPCDV